MSKGKLAPFERAILEDLAAGRSVYRNVDGSQRRGQVVSRTLTRLKDRGLVVQLGMPVITAEGRDALTGKWGVTP